MEPGSALPKVNVRVGETFEGISAADYYGGGNNSSSGGGVMDTPGGEKMSADEESLPASSRPPLNDDDLGADPSSPNVKVTPSPGTFGKELRQNLGGYLGGSFLFDVARGMFCKTPTQAAATVLYCACLGSGFGFTAAGLNQRYVYFIFISV